MVRKRTLSAALVALVAAVPLTATGSGALQQPVGTSADVTAPSTGTGGNATWDVRETSAALVRTGTVTASAAGDYAFLMPQPTNKSVPVRWNPCQVITWSWPGGKPADVTLVQEAMTQLSKKSGLKLQQVASGGKVAVSYGNLPLDKFGYDVLGQGGFSAGGQKGAYLIASTGSLVVDPDAASLQAGEKLELYLHELGHVFGLGHVDAKDEVMHPQVHDQTTYGAGDSAGLKLVGATQGCAEIPSSPKPKVSFSGKKMVVKWTQPGRAELLDSVVVRSSTGKKVSLKPTARKAVLKGVACKPGRSATVTVRSEYGTAGSVITVRSCR